MNNTVKTVQGYIGAAVLCGLLGSTLFVGTAAAQMPGDMDVSVNGMTVNASITRSTPCAPYTLEWGDGEEVVFAEESDFCIEVIATETLQHEYDEAGEYTLTLTLGDNEFTTEVEVTGEEIVFDLADVETITSVWVDPSAQIADEEYYIYTITLTDGTEVKVRAAGFTTEEMRNQQFADAGFTGDVAQLLSMIEEELAEDELQTPVDSPANRAVYQELILVLQTLVEKLTLLLERQQG